MVHDETDIGIDRDANLPYSKGLTAQALMATGLSPEFGPGASPRPRKSAWRRRAAPR